MPEAVHILFRACPRLRDRPHAGAGPAAETADPVRRRYGLGSSYSAWLSGRLGVTVTTIDHENSNGCTEIAIYDVILVALSVCDDPNGWHHDSADCGEDKAGVPDRAPSDQSGRAGRAESQEGRRWVQNRVPDAGCLHDPPACDGESRSPSDARLPGLPRRRSARTPKFCRTRSARPATWCWLPIRTNTSCRC